MKRTATFKTPGDSITIGGQRFHAGNITPEIVDALVALNPDHADHFEVVEAKDDESKADGDEAPAGKKKAPTRSAE